MLNTDLSLKLVLEEKNVAMLIYGEDGSLPEPDHVRDVVQHGR